jgi:hypothetical protein
LEHSQIAERGCSGYGVEIDDANLRAYVARGIDAVFFSASPTPRSTRLGLWPRSVVSRSARAPRQGRRLAL